jgi:hypothetical protein
MNASDYAKFLSLAVPRDPPAMPLGIGEVVKRLWKWMRGMR